MKLAPFAFASALLLGGPAFAGGQFVGDNGSQGMQRAGAFAAKADDPTALYYNPAGLLRSAGTQVFFGVNFVSLEQSFDRSGEYQPQTIDPGESQPDYVGDPYPRVQHQGDAQPVPFVALTYGAEKYALGIGVFAPHGYGGRSYPTRVATASSDAAPAPQRYDAVSQTGVVAFPSAGAAVRLSEEITVGARASWAFARLESTKIVQGVPNRGEEPGRDTTATVSVEDPFAFTFGLGLHVVASPTFELAAAYSAPVSFHAIGTSSTVAGDDLLGAAPDGEHLIEPVSDSEARCAPGGQIDAVRACVYLSLPQTATAGVRWIARDWRDREIADLEIDVRWENWAAASEYHVVIDGRSTLTGAPLNDTVVRYQLDDVYSIRAGASRTVFSSKSRRYHFRGGVAYDTEASPVNWTSLNMDGGSRFTLAGGLGVSFSTLRVDLGLAVVSTPRRVVQDMPVANPDDPAQRMQPDAPVPLLGPDEQPHHPINSGVYESGYSIVSAGITKWF